MTRLYMDHNVPAAITEQLRRRGADCITAEEDAAAEVPDADLLSRASALDRLLVTYDTDFIVIARERIARGERFAGIVFARQLSLTIGEAVRDLELIALATAPEEWQDRLEYLPI